MAVVMGAAVWVEVAAAAVAAASAVMVVEEMALVASEMGGAEVKVMEAVGWVKATAAVVVMGRAAMVVVVTAAVGLVVGQVEAMEAVMGDVWEAVMAKVATGVAWLGGNLAGLGAPRAEATAGAMAATKAAMEVGLGI